MPEQRATAIAHPNIALIKYWGNRDDVLRLPGQNYIIAFTHFCGAASI